MSTTHDIGRKLGHTREQLERLRMQHERDRQALDVLYRLNIACRNLAADREIFDVLSRELRSIFPLDSCFIALCDLEQPDVFRTALLYDEGLIEFKDNVEFGPITERMIRERVPILIDDLDQGHYFNPAR